jgi:DNA-directed RNA polymerase specialized sigma24 family protein
MTTTLTDLTSLQARIESLPAQRAALILRAREEGHTWRDIAESLGMTEHGAIKASKPAQPRGRPRKA